MNKYKIFETTDFSANVDKLAKSSHLKLRNKLQHYVYPQLKEMPHFGQNIKKLKGWEPDTWRYRIGDWRFFYEVDDADKIVFMTAIHHRKDAY